MRCIICLQCNPASGFTREHVFPGSIGGTLTTDRVCKPCNDILGATVDAPLIDHFLISLARMKLGLKGKKGHLPQPLERATIQGDPEQKVRNTYDPTKPFPKKLYIFPKITSEERADGVRQLQFTVDVDDAGKLGDIVNKALRRAGFPPLSPEEIKSLKSTRQRHDMPTLNVPFMLELSHHRRGLMKIAYELAFLWLGEAYLDDATAVTIRACMMDTNMPFDIKSKYDLKGAIPELPTGFIFPFWQNEPDTLIAVGLQQQGAIGIYVRVLGALDGFLTVTTDAKNYPHFTPKFISTHVTSGAMRISTFEEECVRIARSGEAV